MHLASVSNVVPAKKGVILTQSETADSKRMPPAHYRAFFITAIFILLTSGAGWGILFLMQIAVGQKMSAVSLHQINAHGQTVLYGFLGLFIMGFAYQAFPRLWQSDLAYPRLCKPVLMMTLFGILALASGELSSGSPYAGAIVMSGGVIQIVAAGLFGLQLLRTFQRGKTLFSGITLILLVSAAFMVLHTVANVWHTFNLATTESKYEAIYYTSVYQPSLRYLQLHGTVLLMIIGVSSRLLPSFYNIVVPGDRKLKIILTCITLSVFAEAGTFVGFRLSEIHWVAAFLLIPWSVILACVLWLIIPWKIWSPMRDRLGRVDRMSKFVRASYGWLVISLAMTIAQPLWANLAGVYFSHAWYGATRQAFTVGFASMMIMGFTSKIVPTLNGVFPTSLGKLRSAFTLVNVGVALHILFQALSDFFPVLTKALPIAGVLQLLGFLFWAVEMLRHMANFRSHVQISVAHGNSVKLRVI